jgi:cytochrome c oxidase subunit 3
MRNATALRTPAPRPRPPGPADVVPLRGGGGPGPRATPGSLARLGAWLAVGPILMLFLALGSAYVVRRGLGGEWLAVPLPRLVFWNTGALLASSATLEIGRRALRRGGADGGWIWATFALGALFLAGQVAAWVQWTRAGIGVATTAYGSFFYVLTAAHGAHLLVGVGGLLGGALWPREAGRWRLSRSDALQAAAVYWHFMDLLWLGLLLLLTLGR